jgi:hypothetical protein
LGVDVGEEVLYMFKKTKFILALLAVSLITVLAVGCGSTDNEFVGVATGRGSSQVGNLSFAFFGVNPQIAGEVPANTASLRFDMFSTKPPAATSLVLTETRQYSESIVIEDVPINVICVVVTALDANGFPLVSLQGSANVILGETTPVDLGNAEPITFEKLTITPDPTNVSKGGDAVQLFFTLEFSNGSIFQLNSFDAPAASFSQQQTVANITTTGLVSTGVGGQNTTATGSFTVQNITLSDDFVINTYCLDARVSPNTLFIPFQQITGTISNELNYNVQFTGTNGISTQVAKECAYSLVTPYPNVTIDSVTGQLTLSPATLPGTVNILVTYLDPVSGLFLTDTVSVNLIQLSD